VTLANETVHGGDPITVNYTTSATTGYVRLIDEIGTVRAEALLNPHGRSMLQAPYVDVDQDLRVVVDAESGAARSEAEVPVRILAGNPVLGLSNGQQLLPVPALAAGSAANAAASNAGTVAAAGPPLPANDSHSIIALAPVQYKGAPIVVRIGQYEPGLRVAIMGDSGDEIEGADVSPSDSSVALPALGGPQPGRLSVVATYAKGFGQETFIRPFTLR